MGYELSQGVPGDFQRPWHVALNGALNRCFWEEPCLDSEVTRLAGNSTQSKAWSITLVSALFAIAAANDNVTFAYISLFPANIFWCLDAYYLRQERLFRRIYDHVRTADTGTLGSEMFSMDTSRRSLASDGFVKVFQRPPLSVFHFSILVATVVVILVMEL